MIVLDSIACADTFPPDGGGGAQVVSPAGSSGGYAAVKTHDVYVQLAYSPPGVGALLEWTDSVHVPPGNIVIAPGTLGIRFKNYVPGQVATVSAGLSERAEPPVSPTAVGIT